MEESASDIWRKACQVVTVRSFQRHVWVNRSVFLALPSKCTGLFHVRGAGVTRIPGFLSAFVSYYY